MYMDNSLYMYVYEWMILYAKESKTIYSIIIHSGTHSTKHILLSCVCGGAGGCYRVRIGLDTVSVTITDSESFLSLGINMCVALQITTGNFLCIMQYGCDCFYLQFF